MGHKISKEQIDPGVKDHIMSFVGDISELETDEKSDIISAVNSLMVDRVDNAENMGKLANAIGDPVTANHSVDEVVEGLGEMLSTFKTNMMNSGVMVESSDKFKQLIDKIKGLTEGEGNKGIHFAEGTVTVDSPFVITSSNPYTVSTNLDFTPSLIVVSFKSICSCSNITIDSVRATPNNKLYLNLGLQTYDYFYSSYLWLSDVTAESFKIYGSTTYSYSIGSGDPTLIQSSPFTWYAIGVGEEDTTLRDSLASILEEEGVDVTEEDDMASLITKVDEEFDVLSDKADSLDNVRSTLAELMQEGGYDINNKDDINKLLELLTISGIKSNKIKQIVSGGIEESSVLHAATFVIKNDGSLWTAGYNSYGQLGLGDTTDRTLFTQVTTNINNDVKEVIRGSHHTFLLKNDGSLWCCGRNNYGQLGFGDNYYRTTFTQVTTNINNDVKQIACDKYSTFILKNDGSLWCCGRNSSGQLGLGDTTDRTTFTQVTTNINNDVKEVVCGDNHTFILKNDGSLWACGENSSGQLGLGDETDRKTFTQVTTNINNDVKQIACGGIVTFILKNDGSVWSCGYSNYGQLGLGSAGSGSGKTSFTQVTTNINDVKQIVCGQYHTFILKNDGSIWGCGKNSSGQLGLGDETDRKTFTQVTTNINNDVKQLSCGYDCTFIIKNDGSIWSCGRGGDHLGGGKSGDEFRVFPKYLTYD